MRIYILSCARSGSTYTAKFFKKLGFDFVHESTPNKPSKKMGGIGWKLMDDRRKRGLEYDFTLHQVRHPLKFMRSITTMNEEFWEKTQKFIGKLSNKELIRGMEYWCKWNRLCEEKSSFTYRVEDLQSGTELFKKFSSMFGFDPDQKIELKTRQNSRSKKGQYISDVKSRVLRKANKKLFFKLKDQARRYGYII